MEWITITNEKEIPKNKTVIVEDCNGWMGQAYLVGSMWCLETFGQTTFNIVFDKIVRYIIID